MHLQQVQSGGNAPPQEHETMPLKQFTESSSSLPFGQELPLSAISGPTYLTLQTLVQQVAFTLSDKIFTYSPETFDLDYALKRWKQQGEQNAFGYTPGVVPMETRTGAGNIALGYIFSEDFDLDKRHIPQCLIGASASLRSLRSSLDQLSLLYSVASPFVAHVAAVKYDGGSAAGLVPDYMSAINLAEDLGLGLVASGSIHEAQHMALLATLMASFVPSIHIYDGITVGRETTRVVDVLSQSALVKSYDTILKQVNGEEKKQANNEARLTDLVEAFNAELGTEYAPFEFSGHPEAEKVLVVFGTIEASLARQVGVAFAAAGEKVGIINVRVYRPFVEEAFLAALPKTVKTIAVLGQVKDNLAATDVSEQSALYRDVFAAVVFAAWPDAAPSVVDVKYARYERLKPSKFVSILHRMARGDAIKITETKASVDLLGSSARQYIFWDVDESRSSSAPTVLGSLLAQDSSINVSVRTGHDNLVQGGTVRTDLRTFPRTIDAAYSINSADVVWVGEEKLLKDFDVLSKIKAGGSLVLRLPGAKDEDLEKKLPANMREGLSAKKVQLYVLDPNLSSTVTEDPTMETFLAQLAFLRIAREDLFSAGRDRLAAVNGNAKVFDGIAKDMDKALRNVLIPESWSTVEPNDTILPTNIVVNSFTAFDREEYESPTLLRDWKKSAKALAFKEAYNTRNILRPDLPIKTAVVHVQERRRLTPKSYDRNIFHIEFDLGDSGLKYEIGEALGIHQENDAIEVNEFIKWYGLDPNAIVEVPSQQDPDVLENRTVYQSMMQNVDIFGRPPKRFYEALSEFASDEKEKQELLALGGPEGANEFKRRAEVDTVTYADILLDFPSAHPSFHDIVRIVAPMKRREYSIASSQKVTPNSISLLIVTVGWVDPKGRDRFGQATRYLNGLRVGSPVTVSIKPSVMKLPPKTTQPLIMAGLGTGLAPFRAFVQERAWQKQQGHEIGAILLYMGSRHQREEYLYGEEWEAYQDAGIITLLGRAFSRDQPQKIYIQDRMRETLDEIREAYLRQEGSFYLCGPTWPVPDVTNVLEEAAEVEGKVAGKKVEGRKEIERLKEELRYILEVY